MDSLVQLFHLKTSICTFHIRAPHSSFDITLHTTNGGEYVLSADEEQTPLAVYSEPYGACRAVAEHRTGFPVWDASKNKVSDYIGDWTCDVGERFKIQLVHDFLEASSNPSYQDIVEYFEQKHDYLFEREEVADLYRDLLTTGQTTVKLSDWMTPTEFSDMPEITESWLDDDG